MTRFELGFGLAMTFFLIWVGCKSTEKERLEKDSLWEQSPYSTSSMLDKYESMYVNADLVKKNKIKEEIVGSIIVDAHLNKSEDGLRAYIFKRRVTDIKSPTENGESGWDLSAATLDKGVMSVEKDTKPLSDFFEEMKVTPFPDEYEVHEILGDKFFLIEDSEFVQNGIVKGESFAYLSTDVLFFDVSSAFRSPKGQLCVALRFRAPWHTLVKKIYEEAQLAVLFKPERVVNLLEQPGCEHVLLGEGFASSELTYKNEI